MAACALSTKDNPYNPLKDFRSWYIYDISKGYNSCAYLARIAYVNDAMTDREKDIETERAIDEIIKNDLENIYIKVTN